MSPKKTSKCSIQFSRKRRRESTSKCSRPFPICQRRGINECRSCVYKLKMRPLGPFLSHPTTETALRHVARRLEMPHLWGFLELLREQEHGDCGFGQNQQFGLGGNTLTSGQNALLIFGAPLILVEEMVVSCPTPDAEDISDRGGSLGLELG